MSDATNNPLGTVKRLGIDAKGYERRERLEGIAACPVCGKDVELWAETEAWTEVTRRTGQRYWRHSEYGPACGDCCGHAIIDTFEGCVVLDLRES